MALLRSWMPGLIAVEEVSRRPAFSDAQQAVLRYSIDVNQPVGSVECRHASPWRVLRTRGPSCGVSHGGLLFCETSPNAFTDQTRQYTISWGPQWVCDYQFTIISTFHVPPTGKIAAAFPIRVCVIYAHVCLHSLDLRTRLFPKIGEAK